MRKAVILALGIVLLLVCVSGNAEETFRVCTFGSYEQDGNESNGKEPVEWIVILEDDDACYLISRFILSLQLYNVEKVDVTWETCNLRKWLNSDFLNDAFTSVEQRQLYYYTTGDGDSKDLVFCLSEDEVRLVFESENDRIAYPTAVVMSDPDYTNYQNAGQWWLRCESRFNGTIRTAQDIYSDGSVGLDNIRCRTVGVRPVICVEKKAVQSTFADVPKSEVLGNPGFGAASSGQKASTEESLASLFGTPVHVSSFGCTISCPLTWMVITKDMTDSQLEPYGMTAADARTMLEGMGAEFAAVDIISFAELDAYKYAAPMDITLRDQNDIFLETFAASFMAGMKTNYGIEASDYGVVRTDHDVFIRYVWQTGTGTDLRHVITYYTAANGMSYEFYFLYQKEFTPDLEQDIEGIMESIVWD